jgi:hypothetical protein
MGYLDQNVCPGPQDPYSTLYSIFTKQEYVCVGAIALLCATSMRVSVWEVLKDGFEGVQDIFDELELVELEYEEIEGHPLTHRVQAQVVPRLNPQFYLAASPM